MAGSFTPAPIFVVPRAALFPRVGNPAHVHSQGYRRLVDPGTSPQATLCRAPEEAPRKTGHPKAVSASQLAMRGSRFFPATLPCGAPTRVLNL